MRESVFLRVSAVAVQPSESLLQRVDARDFRHQSIEIEICAHFDTLRGHHEHRLLRAAFAPHPDHRLPLLPDAVAVIRPRAPGQQDRVTSFVLRQRIVNPAGRPHAVSDNSNHLGPVLDRVAPEPLVQVRPPGRSDRPSLPPRLPSAPPRPAWPSYWLATAASRLRFRDPQADSRSASPRGVADISTTVNGSAQRLIGPACDTVRSPQRLREGPAGVRLVQDDQRIVRRQPGANRPSHIRCAIRAEQQAGPHLVHRRADHHRLQRRVRPGVVRAEFPRAVSPSRSGSLPPRSFSDCATLPNSESGAAWRRLSGQFHGALRRFVHNYPAVHHEEDPPRRTRRTLGQRKHRDVDQRRLCRPPSAVRSAATCPAAPVSANSSCHGNGSRSHTAWKNSANVIGCPSSNSARNSP